jgi:CRISPR type I-D-associated protein Csc3/Cas10d
MEIISGLVTSYAKFYRPAYSSTSIVRPLAIASKVLLDNPREVVQSEEDYANDLRLMIHGELMNWLDRLRKGEGKGRALFWKDKLEKEPQALSAFADFFYYDLFLKYCRGEAGLLSSRLNNLKSGCEAYYSIHWKELYNLPKDATPDDDQDLLGSEVE